MDRSRSFKNQVFSTALAFALVALVLGAVGCDSGTQEPDAPAASNEFGAAPSASKPVTTPNAAAIKAPRDGSIAPERFPRDLPEGITAEIPRNFPSNIPIYPGAQPAQGKGAEIEGSPVSGVQLLSNDAPTAIFAFYEDKLRANGWDISEATNDPMMGSITATNGNSKTALFIQTSPDGGSNIFIITE